MKKGKGTDIVHVDVDIVVVALLLALEVPALQQGKAHTVTHQGRKIGEEKETNMKKTG